ncbi:5-formyltetrahydrofolate cyclo-ligase [Candidatus Curtissbacteria bacterium]|nr:5-formyltetrahydrofolate cyclo-ligase [Candidatus Curtissbacteria bacterium]
MIKTKQKLRERFLEKRKLLLSDWVKRNSEKINRRLLSFPEIFGRRNFSVYLPINNEVDTKTLIDALLRKRVNIVVPSYSKESRNYFWAKFLGWNNLEKGPFKILQPAKIFPVDSLQIEVAIIPGLCFSKTGTRLGYGKGVFDRLLKKTNAFKIGLAYDFQIVDNLPKEIHDLAMDAIITEKRVIRS